MLTTKFLSRTCSSGPPFGPEAFALCFQNPGTTGIAFVTKHCHSERSRSKIPRRVGRNLLFASAPQSRTQRSSMSVYEKLKSLNITLPKLDPPVAAFVPFVRAGNLVFISGHIAKKGAVPWAGKLGADLPPADGKEAAQAIAVDLLATLQAAVHDLNNIRRIVKL